MPAMRVPGDYPERVYAGVLGKLIGSISAGRSRLELRADHAGTGSDRIYVHDRLGQPLVVTDDDVAGTFTFIRALDDYGVGRISAPGDRQRVAQLHRRGADGALVGRQWGFDRAYRLAEPEARGDGSGLRLRGVNGRTVAEQIGAHLHRRGAWSRRSAGAGGAAGRAGGAVSHDGEAVHAAMLWAAMEAEAFGSAEIGHLLEVGLARSARLPDRAADRRRSGLARGPDWRRTRAHRAGYGYDWFPGNRRPGAEPRSDGDGGGARAGRLREGDRIVNTSGRDTDWNAGNVGCLLGIMHGLAGLGWGRMAGSHRRPAW